MMMMIYSTFNCNWIDTRWQYDRTHLQADNA